MLESTNLYGPSHKIMCWTVFFIKYLTNYVTVAVIRVTFRFQISCSIALTMLEIGGTIKNIGNQTYIIV